jgi:hypothetical protein
MTWNYLRFSALGTIPRRTSWCLNALAIDSRITSKQQVNFGIVLDVISVMI